MKFKLQRTLKFKVVQQNAARLGQPVPVNTPELEAIGIMSDVRAASLAFSLSPSLSHLIPR